MHLDTWKKRKFTAWRKAVNVRLPGIAIRVFALRDKFYMGCGFHWGLERTLGNVIAGINNYDADYHNGIDGVSRQVLLEWLGESLFSDVVKAEQDAECRLSGK